MKKLKKYQAGGTQVYRIENNQYQPVNYGMPFQAASMPIASGFEPYLQLEQLENQRNQLQLQEDEFKWQVQNTEKRQLREDLKNIQSVNNEFLKLKVLPSDSAAVENLVSQTFNPELMKRAASGDQSAINELMINSNTVMASPVIIRAISRKNQNDDNSDRWSKLSKIEEANVTNWADAYQAVQAGEPIPAPRFDEKNLKTSLDLELQATRDSLNAKALQASADAELTKQKLEDLKSMSPILKQIKEQELSKMKILVTIEDDKLKRYTKLVEEGMDPEKASQKAGLTKAENSAINNMYGYALKLSEEQDIDLEDALSVVADLVKTSNVNYNSDNKTTTSKDGIKVKSFVNHRGEIIDIDTKDSLPDGIQALNTQSGPVLKIKLDEPGQERREWLKEHFGWNYDSGINYELEDFPKFNSNSKISNGYLYVPLDTKGQSDVPKNTNKKNLPAGLPSPEILDSDL